MSVEQVLAISEMRRMFADGRAARIRQEARLTQAEIASVLGVESSAVSHWEAGRRSPRGESALRCRSLLESLAAPGALAPTRMPDTPQLVAEEQAPVEPTTVPIEAPRIPVPAYGVVGTRALNTLARNGIRLQDVCDYSDAALLAIPDFGHGQLRFIREQITESGSASGRCREDV